MHELGGGARDDLVHGLTGGTEGDHVHGQPGVARAERVRGSSGEPAAEQTHGLAGYTARAMRWLPFLAAAALGYVVVAAPAVTSVVLSDHDLTNLLRFAALCVAVGVAFLLDDPAARSIVTVPTGRLTRHAVRAALALPVVGAWWAVAVVTTIAGAEHDIGKTVPVWAVTLEAGTLIATALCLAAVGLLGAANGMASTVAAPALLALATVLYMLPTRIALFLAPGDPQWTAAHGRWWLLLAIAFAVGIWASRSRVSRIA